MEPISEGARQGVHPFCGPCTDETIAWFAPDTGSVNGIGTHFYGAVDPCLQCGSVVKRLFFCVLFIPLWPMGRYRVVTTRRSLTRTRYIGRRFPKSADNPYGLRGTTAEPAAQAQAEAEEVSKSWPEPPPSRLSDHPELRGERYQEAQNHWEFGFPERALPLYEEELAAHEAVLPADDTATLQLRQRVAEAYLAVGRLVEGLALLKQTHAHLKRVLGPSHPDTNRALNYMLNSGIQMSENEVLSYNVHLAHLKRTVGLDGPEALRVACALGSAHVMHSSVVQALEVLEDTLARAERTLGADHPDTVYVREELIAACEFAEYRAEPDDVLAATRARERLYGPDAPETLTATRDLARLYASSRRHRRKAVDVLSIALERCERALGPEAPLTADVRRRLEELG